MCLTKRILPLNLKFFFITILEHWLKRDLFPATTHLLCVNKEMVITICCLVNSVKTESCKQTCRI